MNEKRLHSRVAKQAAFLAKCARLKITNTQFSFLAYVHLNPGSGPSELAKAFNLSTAAITECFNTLRFRGLAAKRNHATDERRKFYVLTKEGSATLETLTHP